MVSPEDSAPEDAARVVENDPFLCKPGLKIRSDAEIWAMSLGSVLVVFLCALALQWIIYDRFLHQNGLRLVGSVISGAFAALLVHGMSLRTRRSRLSELSRL
jgi:hypothetical protein